jgi:hypothetical protein
VTFFNKKEDILQLQLTPYGRKLLSQGKLKPEFYAFFDDDIIYEAEKAGITETNSQTKTRILTETPSLKPVATNFGVETNINTVYEHVIDNYMPNPIGTSSPIEKKTAGWEVFSLDKEFDTFELSSSLNSSIQNIPQVNCTLNFTMSVDKFSTFEGDFEDLVNDFDFETDADGNFIKLEKETLVLYLTEKNGFVNNDAYSVEVFMYEEDDSNLKKIDFTHKPKNVKNDIYYEVTDPTGDVTKDNVEYYIDLLVDSEIPDREICKGLKKLKENNIYLELDLKCPDKQLTNINIYNSTIGDVEECE